MADTLNPLRLVIAICTSEVDMGGSLSMHDSQQEVWKKTAQSPTKACCSLHMQQRPGGKISNFLNVDSMELSNASELHISTPVPRPVLSAERNGHGGPLSTDRTPLVVHSP